MEIYIYVTAIYLCDCDMNIDFCLLIEMVTLGFDRVPDIYSFIYSGEYFNIYIFPWKGEMLTGGR